MSARPHLGLALLTLRRALGGRLALLLVPLALLAARARWAPEDEGLVRLVEAGAPGGVAHALTLAGVWWVLLLAAGPWLVLRAAAVVPRWRRGELDWLASAPRSRTSLVLSAAVGLGLALVLAVGAATLVAGLAARSAGGPGGAPALRVGAGLRLPAAVLAGDRALRVELDPGPRATEVRVRLAPLAGGAGAGAEGGVAGIRLTLARGGERSVAEARVAARAELRATLPPGSGPCELVLEHVGGGPQVALLAGSAEALQPVRALLAADLSVASRALLALAGWCALALGLGAWIGGSLAALLTLSLALLGLTGGGALPVGGTALVRALELVGEGLVPGALGVAEPARALLVVALGLVLARAGLAGGGSA